MYVGHHHEDVFVLVVVGVVPVVFVVRLLSFCWIGFPVVVFESKLVLQFV